MSITDKILTVIVPTYNMEQYLEYCLTSLCVDKNIGRLEILVINDGSKDCSSAIAHEFEDRFPHVFKVIDKENGNYGSCINTGLKNATGKYVKVLDADDSVDTECFENFISFLIETDADLVLSDFAVVNREREIRKIIKYDFGNGNLFRFNDICRTGTFKNMQMHAVTYRLENLLKLGYKQTEGISYTDQEWIFIPMIMVKTVACFKHYVYKYLVGRVGQTINPEVKLKSMVHTERCAASMVTEYENHRDVIIGKPVQEYLYARLVPMVKDVYVFSLTHYGEKMKKQLNEFDGQLKILSEEIYSLIGSREISSFMGFEYISYWRNHKRVNPIIISVLSKGYLLLLKIKQLSRKPDEMAIPMPD
ncbi:glycosyltransferase family 2 protein [uncultured Bacteroides sp.]|uniref:glycosyltransferase family 2 protein n=1 Tax=uncultured Bacteroides sp. TaxID=162156 RepID=UPI002676EFE2|nr:glycosyltransferase family 2 protein [uncultured Bacteroides sp.]